MYKWCVTNVVLMYTYTIITHHFYFTMHQYTTFTDRVYHIYITYTTLTKPIKCKSDVWIIQYDWCINNVQMMWKWCMCVVSCICVVKMMYSCCFSDVTVKYKYTSKIHWLYIIYTRIHHFHNTNTSFWKHHQLYIIWGNL